MTLDGFLTFLTLAVAIFALVPEVTRLRAKLTIWPQILLGVGALGFVLYLQFFELLAAPCPAWLGRTCRWLVLPTGEAPGVQVAEPTPQQISFLIVLLWMVVASIVLKFSKPTARALPAMERVVEDLIHEQRYAEVLTLTRPHLALIKTVTLRKLCAQRIYDRLSMTITALEEKRLEAMIREETAASPAPMSRDKALMIRVWALSATRAIIPRYTAAEALPRTSFRHCFVPPP